MNRIMFTNNDLKVCRSKAMELSRILEVDTIVVDGSSGILVDYYGIIVCDGPKSSVLDSITLASYAFEDGQVVGSFKGDE